MKQFIKKGFLYGFLNCLGFYNKEDMYIIKYGELYNACKEFLKFEEDYGDKCNEIDEVTLHLISVLGSKIVEKMEIRRKRGLK